MLLSPERNVAVVHLARCSPLSSAAAVEFALPSGGGGGVDLGAVGRALGLDPSTVLLNGYYLSRGPDFVSAGVTWHVLLAFFSARGMPDGETAGDAIAVQGRPFLPLPPDSEGGDSFSFKRKIGLEDDSLFKKNRGYECNPANVHGTDRRENSYGGLCMKRTLEPKDTSLSKKQNTAGCDSETSDFRDPQVIDDGSIAIKRKLVVEGIKQFKRQNTTGCNFGKRDFVDQQVSSDKSICIKRALQLEESSNAVKRNRQVSYDGSFATKRIPEVEDGKQFRKHNISRCNSGIIHFRDGQVSSDSSQCINRALESEDNCNTLKRKNTAICNSGTRNFGAPGETYGDNICSKRRPKFDDSSSLKQKISEFNPESESVCISGSQYVTLVPAPSLATAQGERKAVSLPVAYSRGVDLGAIGRMLRLDPATVRLNNHFLSRGNDLVSSVTWYSVLSFFSARGFPTGSSLCNPIVVQGKPLLTTVSRCHSAPEDSSHRSIQRKVVLEDESPCKKMIGICDSGKIDVTEVQTDDGNSYRNRRKLVLEDNSPCKKLKADSVPYLGLANGASTILAAALKTGITCNEISEQGTKDRIRTGIS